MHHCHAPWSHLQCALEPGRPQRTPLQPACADRLAVSLASCRRSARRDAVRSRLRLRRLMRRCVAVGQSCPRRQPAPSKKNCRSRHPLTLPGGGGGAAAAARHVLTCPPQAKQARDSSRPRAPQRSPAGPGLAAVNPRGHLGAGAPRPLSTRRGALAPFRASS